MMISETALLYIKNVKNSVTKRQRISVVQVLIIILFLFLPVRLNGEPKQVTIDILFVLDNSGSMKLHDPDFMTGKSVKNMVNKLNTNSRAGFVVFDNRADLVMPLTNKSDSDFKIQMDESLSKLNYKGQFTNIPAAIEKALYQLKQYGRKDAEKLIIFMTDGFIDTGNTNKDTDSAKWLKEELTAEAKNAGIRIISLAFTENADFELIQTLAVKTEGGYYRASRIEDIEKIFANIRHAILNTIENNELIEKQNGVTNGYMVMIVVVAGLTILGIIVINVRSSNDDSIINNSIIKHSVLPDAILEDLENITGNTEVRLYKREMLIGRAENDGKSSVDIAIPQHTISALHAAIEFRNNGFYLTDLRSTNKTYLNNQFLSPDIAQRLKSGDFITFDKYKFRFIVNEQKGETGTLLRPVSAGGTILRPQAKEINAPQIDDAEGTHVKPGMCDIHPSYKATEFCPICRKGFCAECMVEKDGRTICRTCAEKLSSDI